MSDMLSFVLGVALLAAVSVFLLKNLGSSIAPLIGCLCGVVILSAVSMGLINIGGQIVDMAALPGISEYASAALKIIGVGYLSGTASDICETLGEGFAARGVMLCGKVEILIISMPYFLKVINMAVSQF